MRILYAFDDLSTCRVSGMSLGPIPHSAVIAWANHNGMSYETTQFLWRVIRQVDHLVLARLRKAST